jgi:hypothetical protein
MAAPELLLNPVTVPLIRAAVHPKVVPATAGTLVIAILVVAPLQIVVAVGVAMATGIGFTVTSTVTAVPEHPFAVGVMVYLTTPAVLFALDRDWEMGVPAPFEKPVIVAPLNCIAVQPNVVPATAGTLVSAMVVVAPLHIVWEAGVAVTEGIGLTVISTVMGVPEQLFAVGVMVYLTTAIVFVALSKVWVIGLPPAFENPVAVPLCNPAVQPKVVPATLFGLVSVIEVVEPLQMVCEAGLAVTLGIGLTVISTVIGKPLHPLAEGVMVYLTTAIVLVALERVWVMALPPALVNPDAIPL